MSQSLINPYIFGIPAPPVGGQGTWSEIGRTTLGVAGDSITVPNLPTKEFYMFLVNIIDSPDIQLNIRLGAGSVDAGANYASRDSTGGAGDVQRATQNQILLSINSALSLEQFGFGYIQNLQGNEKLLSYSGMTNQDAVDANYFRSQVAGKWSNVNNLTHLSLENLGTGTFPIGSELVVLGFSRFDDGNSPNFWNLLGENTAAGGETVLATPVFAKKKYLWVKYQMGATTGSAFSFQARYGQTTVITTANSYQNRTGGPAADSGNFANLNQLILTSGNSANYANVFVLNRPGTEKLWHGTTTSDRLGAGPPELVRNIQWGKQKDLTLKTGQIDIVNMYQQSGTGVLDAGSKVSVWGND